MDIKSPPIRQHNSITLILFGGENLFKGNQAAQRIKQKCLTESLLNPTPLRQNIKHAIKYLLNQLKNNSQAYLATK